jgi:hypothetical protein
MSHYELENENMHPLEYIIVSLFFLGLGNFLIYVHPPTVMQVQPFDYWEFVHKLGYLVPFVGLFINQRRTIFGWFKKKRK